MREENLIKEIDYKGFNIKLCYDEGVENPFEQDEGLGNFYHWKDYGTGQLEKYCEALGFDIDTREKIGKENPDAVKIDKYEHSGISYFISGEGIQCRFDTSPTWAVWLPNDCLLEDLKRFKTKETRRKRCIQLAREACEVFNKWANGEIYGFVVEDKQGNNYDSCWGFYEQEDAIKEAKSNVDYYVKEAKKLQLQY